MNCSICGRSIDPKDDAVEVLKTAGLYKAVASLVSDHCHLEAHPEYGCPGSEDAREALDFNSPLSMGDCS